MPSSRQTEGEDGLHLLIVLDGLVKEFSVLGVILQQFVFHS